MEVGVQERNRRKRSPIHYLAKSFVAIVVGVVDGQRRVESSERNAWTAIVLTIAIVHVVVSIVLSTDQPAT